MTYVSDPTPDDRTRTHQDDTLQARPARQERRAKRPPSRRPWLLTAGVLVAAAIGLALWRPWQRPPVDAPPADDLAAAIAEADRLDPGWRWEQIWASRQAVPDAENAAPVVLEAAGLLPVGGELPAFLSPPLPPYLDPAQLAELSAWLRPRAAGLKAALALADRPRGRFDLKVAPDYISTLLPHAQDLSKLRYVLLGEAVRRAEAGDAGTLVEFRALFNAGRAIGDEPIAVSQLVRLGVTNAAVLGLERTLGRTTVGEPALAVAQQLVSDEIDFPAYRIGMRGERAMLFGLCDAIDTGKVTVAQFNESFKSVSPRIEWPADARPGSAALREASAWQVRRTTRLVEVAGLPLADQPAALAKAKAATPPPPPAAKAFESLGDLFGEPFQQSAHRREALLRAAVVALAAERHRLRHGRWPVGPKEMDGPLPVDPYDGSPLRFRRLDDGLVVYSIGADGRDNGGDLGDRGPTAADVGFRLWDATRQR